MGWVVVVVVVVLLPNYLIKATATPNLRVQNPPFLFHWKRSKSFMSTLSFSRRFRLSTLKRENATARHCACAILNNSLIWTGTDVMWHYFNWHHSSVFEVAHPHEYVFIWKLHFGNLSRKPPFPVKTITSFHRFSVRDGKRKRIEKDVFSNENVLVWTGPTWTVIWLICPFQPQSHERRPGNLSKYLTYT